MRYQALTALLSLLIAANGYGQTINEPLTVNGTITTTGGSEVLLNNPTNTSLSVIKNSGASNAGTMEFSTSGAERLRIDATGRIGIGTTSPTRKLTVAGEIQLHGYPTGVYFGNNQGLYDNANAGLILNTTTANTDISISPKRNLILGPNTGNVTITGVETGDPAAYAVSIGGGNVKAAGFITSNGKITTPGGNALSYFDASPGLGAGVRLQTWLVGDNPGWGPLYRSGLYWNAAVSSTGTNNQSVVTSQPIFVAKNQYATNWALENQFYAMRMKCRAATATPFPENEWVITQEWTDGQTNLNGQVRFAGGAVPSAVNANEILISGGRLMVGGIVSAKEVRVTTTGADYVFADDYRLRPLGEVETYIKTEKHLPDMMSAKEMQDHGMPLAEVVTKQLAKIEELTLYAIEAHHERVAARQQAKATATQLIQVQAQSAAAHRTILSLEERIHKIERLLAEREGSRQGP